MPVINFSAMGFYGRNRGNYRKLWEILGREWTSLAVEATWSAQNIPGKDHGLLKVDLTEAQRHALLPVLTSMGLFRALSLRPGQYAELELTGAKFKSMVARVTDIRETYLEPRDGEGRSKYRFGRIVCQFGQRPRTDWQDGTVEQIKENLSAKVLAHQWVNQELAKFGEDPFYGPFATEFELGILAFIVAFDGAVEVGTYVGATDTVSLSGVPLRAVENCTLTLPDGTPVLVINSPAVERPHGDPRPTTDSSTEYRQTHYPPEEDGTIVGVTSAPHGQRVMRSFEQRVHTRFPHVTVYAISRSASAPMDVLNNALGEAVWLLVKTYEEWRAEA